MNFMSLNIRGISGDAKVVWVKDLKNSNNISVIALQETKVVNVSRSALAKLWGNRNFEFASVDSVGLSGGLVWLWDPEVLKIESLIQRRFCLVIKGSVVGSEDPINLINVYAPQNTEEKLSLWNEISSFIDPTGGKWVIVGDFNAVRSQEERKRSKFKPVCSDNFNNFIFANGLLEYPMQGRKFTCIRDNGRKLSKLDRFLVCSEFFNRWPSACVRVLPSRLSDHCPIILELVDLKFGPRPFRVFTSWIGKPGFEEAFMAALEGFEVFDPPDKCLTAKFARIKLFLRKWRDDFLAKEMEVEKIALAELEQMEIDMESRDLVEEEEWVMTENRKIIKEIEERKNLDSK
ncbi:uncharacterized protein LOC110913868 [Helianthus annuus]|uniref:uncharacterized protein LOC110913868 n=1 Tax=Helianthus annuus TaxID=4232 RepID=UPI000B9009DF|nr:uncharacterized protein LOC110913868 [Helianthus annuus]